MTEFGSLNIGSPAWEQSLLEGDIIALGPSKALVFEIVVVRGDKAWVRALDDGRDGVIDLASFRELGFRAPGMIQ